MIARANWSVKEADLWNEVNQQESRGSKTHGEQRMPSRRGRGPQVVSWR